MQRKEQFPYEDILLMQRPEGGKRGRMPVSDRAAQFLPFSALTGYDAAVKETERLTETRVELDEDCKAFLNEKLMHLKEHPDQRYKVSITWFQPDGKKAGGAYCTVAGIVKKLDEYEKTVYLEDGTKILMEQILDVQIDCEGEE